MSLRFLVVTLLLCVAAHGARKKACPTGDLDPATGTARFVNLVQLLAGKHGAIDQSELKALGESPVPVNPLELSSARLNLIQNHTFREAFERLLAEGGLDWPRVREEIEKVQRARGDQDKERDGARKDSAGIFLPVVRKSNVLPQPMDAMISNMGSWTASDGSHFITFKAQSQTANEFLLSVNGNKLIALNQRSVSDFFEDHGARVLVTAITMESGGRPKAVEVLDARTGASVHKVDLSKVKGVGDYGHPPGALVYRNAEGGLGVVSVWGPEHSGNIVDMKTGKATALLRGLPEGKRLEFVASPDGSRVFAYGFFDQSARVYDLLTGKLLFQMPAPKQATGNGIWAMHCTKAGDIYLVTGGKQAIDVYDVTHKRRRTLPIEGKPQLALPAFLEDGAGVVHLGFSDADKRWTLVDVVNPSAAPQTVESPHGREIVKATHLGRLPDGRIVAVSPWEWHADSGNKMVAFDFKAGQAMSIPLHLKEAQRIEVVVRDAKGNLVGYSADDTGPNDHYQISEIQLFGPK